MMETGGLVFHILPFNCKKKEDKSSRDHVFLVSFWYNACKVRFDKIESRRRRACGKMPITYSISLQAIFSTKDNFVLLKEKQKRWTSLFVFFLIFLFMIFIYIIIRLKYMVIYGVQVLNSFSFLFYFNKAWLAINLFQTKYSFVVFFLSILNLVWLKNHSLWPWNRFLFPPIFLMNYYISSFIILFAN